MRFAKGSAICSIKGSSLSLAPFAGFAIFRDLSDMQ